MRHDWTRLLRRYGRDDSGAITAETVIILPVVFWAFMATFVYFDAFAARTDSQRAAYTVADAIGRQQFEPLTPADIDSYNRVFSYLAGSQPRTNIRVSSVIWNPIIEQYEIVWSYGTNNMVPMTEANLTPQVIERFPVLPTRESIYVVETMLDYAPIMRSLPLVGRVLDRQTLRQFIIARPRFAPQLRFDDGTGVVGTTFPTCDDPGVLCDASNPSFDSDGELSELSVND